MDIQPNDFRYFLTLNNVRTEIVFAPSGWEKNSVVSYKRDMSYFGMIRTWGLPLDFVMDGAAILKRAYYQYGVEAGVRIEVEKLNRSTWVYERGFIGDIDFSEFKVDKDVVSVTLMESGPTANIKAFDGVKYEYELSGDDVVNMKLPGVAFSEKATSLFDFLTGSGHKRFIPSSSISVNEMLSGHAESQSVDYQDVSDTSFSSSSNWFVRANRLLSINVNGRMKGVSFSAIGPQGFDVYLMNNDNVIVSTLYSSPSSPPVLDFDFSFNVNITLIQDQRLFVYCRYRTVGSGFIDISEGDLNVSYNSISDESDCKGISGFNLFKRIIKRVSPGTAVDSNLLHVDRKNLIFTSGDGIREIQKAKIKISLKDFFKCINGIEDAGMGIENSLLRMEYASYFARNIQIVDVGEVKTFKPRVAKEFMFNSIKIGYNDGNTDELNGRFEYNSGQNWALLITRIQTVKDWVSPVRADQFGIENLRVNVVKKATADNKGDNETFMVDCYIDGDDYRPILGNVYQSITDLPNGETAYNLDLTPKKNLLRHGAYLRGVMANMDASYINFGSGDKNTELKTVKNSIGVKENENIVVASLPEKYFLPTIVNITCELSRNAMRMFDAIPFGYVKFSYNGVVMKGYVLECNIDIARNTEQEFQLLLTNDNNLLELL